MAWLNFMREMAIGGGVSNRSNALRTEVEEITIDTCYCNDTLRWETGIKRGDNSWEIVQEYEDEAEAKKGHEKWVQTMKDTPNMDLSKLNEESRDRWIGF